MTEDGKVSQLGAIGQNVVRNVEELRHVRNLSLRALSDRLAEIGRPILPIGLSRLSQGKRRVDADDLVALAVVLGVSPVSLLLPRDQPWDAEIELSPEVHQKQWVAWRWAALEIPLPPEVAGDAREIITPGEKLADFQHHSRPQGTAPQVNSAQTASYDLSVELSVMARDPGNPDMVDLRLSRIRRAYQRLGLELDALEEDERLKVAVNVGGGTWTKVAPDGTVKRVAVGRDWPDPVPGPDGRMPHAPGQDG
jgi:hypothetical protein